MTVAPHFKRNKSAPSQSARRETASARAAHETSSTGRGPAPATDDCGRWRGRPPLPRAKIVPAGRGADAGSTGGAQPRLSLLPRGMSNGWPVALGTQIEIFGPALQPTQGTLRRHPIHRAYARALAHHDVGSCIDRCCASAAWEIIERQASPFLAGQLTGVCGKRALWIARSVVYPNSADNSIRRKTR
jgi:hypothetical protein